jgi:hypothetical protein
MWLCFAGAAAVLVFLISPLSPLAQAAGAAGMEDLTWSPSKPVQHKTRGGLFHPKIAGQGRTGLIDQGYAWLEEPPSEMGLFGAQ